MGWAAGLTREANEHLIYYVSLASTIPNDLINRVSFKTSFNYIRTCDKIECL